MTLRILSCVLAAALLVASCAAPNSREAPPILWDVDWSPDGSSIVVGGERTLKLATITDRGSISLRDIGASPMSETTITRARWHSRSGTLAIVSQGVNASGIYRAPPDSMLVIDAPNSRGLAWSPDGSRLATAGTGDGHLKIWSSAGVLLHETPRHGDAQGLTGAAWSPSGDRIVTVGRYVTIHATDGRVLKQITHRPEARERLCLLLCVAWHPSGSFFVTGDYGNDVDDPVLQIWSDDGERLRTIPLPGAAEIRNVSWSPDGGQLAVASSELFLFGRTGDLDAHARSPTPLWGVDWHPSDGRLVTSSTAGVVTIWSSKLEPVETLSIR